MSKWIKPTDLPEDFWGECFIATYCSLSDKVCVHENSSMVKRTKTSVLFFVDFDDDKGWLEFRKDTEHVKTIVMPIIKPTVTKEDFK